MWKKRCLVSRVLTLFESILVSEIYGLLSLINTGITNRKNQALNKTIRFSPIYSSSFNILNRLGRHTKLRLRFIQYLILIVKSSFCA